MCEYSPHERSRPSGAKVSHVGNARSALAAAVQDLELRAYSASLVDTSFVGIAFGRSSGDIAFDPTLPISNVDATIYSPVLGRGHTFGVFGKQALFTGTFPYAWGNISGDVGEQRERITRSGLADVKTRLSITLRGSPALSPVEFARRPHLRLCLAKIKAFTPDTPSGRRMLSRCFRHTRVIPFGEVFGQRSTPRGIQVAQPRSTAELPVKDRTTPAWVRPSRIPSLEDIPSNSATVRASPPMSDRSSLPSQVAGSTSGSVTPDGFLLPA
jgi:hypothetical protein